MKTTLPTEIKTIADAKTFLKELVINNEAYHPEENAHEIIWSTPQSIWPTFNECELLNKLMEDIYNLDGNNGNHANPKFDPCKFILASFNKDED